MRWLLEEVLSGSEHVQARDAGDLFLTGEDLLDQNSHDDQGLGA